MKMQTMENWIGKTIQYAGVVSGGDGELLIRFTDGIEKRYGFNELGFWDADTNEVIGLIGHTEEGK